MKVNFMVTLDVFDPENLKSFYKGQIVMSIGVELDVQSFEIRFKI